MLAATGTGQVDAAWMDVRTGRWNTWLRHSDDGGVTWTDERRLSDRPGGAPYKTPAGFRFPYGDYGELAIGSGVTWAIWGEGLSYDGPGGSWFTSNR
jgi:hypothetical protein